MQYIEPMAKLIENFRSLPGIGSKTAVRLAYHVLDMDKEKAKALADSITRMQNKENGLIPTHWMTADCVQTGGDLWINCMIATANRLFEIAEYIEKQ